MAEDLVWTKAHSQYITIYYRKSQDELRKLAATRDEGLTQWEHLWMLTLRLAFPVVDLTPSQG